MSGKLIKPQIATVEALVVEKDISGGVKIVLGGQGFVLPPSEAVKFAEGVLQAVGMNVRLTGNAVAALAAADMEMRR